MVAGMEHRVYEVADIHCGNCEAGIRRALDDVEGVDDVVPDHRTNTVRVSFDGSRLDEDRIGDLLTGAGFAPKAVRAAEPGSETGDRGEAARAGSDADDGAGDRSLLARYGLLVAGVAVVALAGYVGYELYPRFDLPAAEGAGLLVLAAAAGIASFFAPCSFPLLVTLLSRPGGGNNRDAAPARPLVYGAALSVGAAAFLLLSGVAIALGGRAFFESVTFTSTTGRTLRIVVGGLLIVLGLIQLGRLADTSFRSVEGLTKKLNRSQARLRRRHPVAGHTAFGFFYLLAGFG